jgi:hypothetical protein
MCDAHSHDRGWPVFFGSVAWVLEMINHTNGK